MSQERSVRDVSGLYSFVYGGEGGFEPPLGCLVPKTV
jgi:hypothetical protein